MFLNLSLYLAISLFCMSWLCVVALFACQLSVLVQMAYRSWRYREKGLIREYPEMPEELPTDLDANLTGNVDYQGSTAATLRVNTVMA